MVATLIGVTDAGHIPVLLAEVLELLAPRPGETYVDATAGLGGHAAAIAPHLGPDGTVILNDVDPANLPRAEEAVRKACRAANVPTPRIVTFRGNFADLPRLLPDAGLRADMLLADLGFASHQMADAERGLSFMREGPLDMRLDPSLPTTAADLVQSLSERELAAIFRDFGEESGASRVARKIVATRTQTPILTTAALADLVRSVLGSGAGKAIDPATKVFQALRIAVNDELGVLDALLAGIARAGAAQGGPSWLEPEARIGIISFHSLEDRQVKQTFAEMAEHGHARAISTRPIRADEAETAGNRRARSAKLRGLRLGSTPVEERRQK